MDVFFTYDHDTDNGQSHKLDVRHILSYSYTALIDSILEVLI